jgi:hypothetical protein
MPRGVYERKVYAGKPVRQRRLSKIRQDAAISRWDSVRAEKENWLSPFRELTIERAMAYLEDLRKICEDAGHILNDRINNPKSPMKCAGPRCGKDLSGTNPSGRPKWIAKKDFRDEKHPEIIRSLYFCSELCNNGWARARQGAGGGDGR